MIYFFRPFYYILDILLMKPWFGMQKAIPQEGHWNIAGTTKFVIPSTQVVMASIRAQLMVIC